MSLLPIDKNVPIPGKYPFANMQVGDSFALPTDAKRIATYVAAKRYGDKHGMKFTVRKVGDGFRCWRVA